MSDNQLMAAKILCLLIIVWVVGFAYGVAFMLLGSFTGVLDVSWWIIFVYPAQAITVFLGGIVMAIASIVLYFARRI